MGEVFDDGAIQEATTLEDEYEVTLVGYFKNDGKGIELFKKACEDFRSED